MGLISVIGSLNMDMVVRVPRNPFPGETLGGNDFRLIPGGKGANQAVAASRAGAPTQMIGCIGKDSFGDILCNSLNEAGVEVNRVRTISNVSTGIAMILVEDTGENRIIIVPGANSLVSMAFVDEIWASASQSSLILLQHEIPLETVHHIIQCADREGIPIVLNASPFYPIPKGIMKIVGVLVINETEASALSGIKIHEQESALDAAQALHNLGPRTVIVTLGALGSVLVNSNYRLYQPGISVKVVDTTAAGDTFVGGTCQPFWMERMSHPPCIMPPLQPPWL